MVDNRIRVYIMPLLRSLLEHAGKLAIAMEARCFNEHRTDPELTFYKKDWVILLTAISTCLIALQF